MRPTALCPTDVYVRPRRERDLPALTEGLQVVAAADGYPSRWPADPSAWLRGRDVIGAWVAVLDDVVVGQALARRASNDPPARMLAEVGADPAACAVVGRMFVVPAARGRGLGEALVCAAWDESRSRGMHAVLDVVSTNRAAVRLYERLGWRHLGDYSQAFGDGGPDELLHCYAAPASPG